MTPPPDHQVNTALGLANLFSVMERLKEAERQDRKAGEDAKLAQIQKRGELWWHKKEDQNNDISRKP